MKKIVISLSAYRQHPEGVLIEGKAILKLTQLYTFMLNISLKFNIKHKQELESL